MADLLYYYKKNNGSYQRNLLGEICTGFNIGYTIDGSKDSCKLQYVCYTELDIKPYDIVYHPKTNSWWVVADDKSERYENEKGYFYIHNISLLGAIELLNTKVLTDCGFYGGRYTLEQIFDRLCDLSFGLDIVLSPYVENNCVELEQTIDYTKSFENYTLLSALREMFDGYNCALKLAFFTIGSGPILSGIVRIMPKTGNYSNIYDYDDFNDVQEKREMHKSNYGTSVISNSQNIISQKTNTYPSIGTVRLFGTAYTTTRNNARLRLPSAVFDMNYIKMYYPLNVYIDWEDSDGHQAAGINVGLGFGGYSGNNINKLREKIIANFVDLSPYLPNEIVYDFADIAEQYYQKVVRASTVPFYANSSYNPIDDTIIAPEGHDNPYFYLVQWSGESGANMWFDGNVGIMEKSMRDGLKRPDSAIYWERGKDEIGGFDFLGTLGRRNDDAESSFLSGFNKTELQDGDIISTVGDNYILYTNSFTDSNNVIHTFTIYVSKTTIGTPNLNPKEHVSSPALNTTNVRFIVNYIPMQDTRIKYNSERFNNIEKLYNQIGKMSSANGLSKLITSYAKEILSDKIVKYGTYYDIDDVPQIGGIVQHNGKDYVIGNVSMDIDQNEDETYIIYGEFTLSYAVATKSLLTEANTAIRDYNIPQNLNVKRKQLYQDVFSLVHVRTEHDCYFPLYNYLRPTTKPVDIKKHVAVCKLDYDREVNGSYTYYYQLETSIFFLKKQVYEVVDFKDNNIIAYDCYNTNTGFLISETFSHFYDSVSTPISYVDEMGEVRDFTLAFVDIEKINQIYERFEYFTANTIYNGDLLNYSTFIDSRIYNGVSGTFDGAKDECDFMIQALDYKKDTIEVPVFEYVCETKNSDDVIIGENAMYQEEDDLYYLYNWAFVDKGTINENNFNSLDLDDVIEDSENFIEMSYGCLFGTTSEDRFFIAPCTYQTLVNGTPDYQDFYNLDNLPTDKDLVIVRRTIKKNYTTQSSGGHNIIPTKNDLFLVIKNLDNAVINKVLAPALLGHNAIELKANCFKSH